MNMREIVVTTIVRALTTTKEIMTPMPAISGSGMMYSAEQFGKLEPEHVPAIMIVGSHLEQSDKFEVLFWKGRLTYMEAGREK